MANSLNLGDKEIVPKPSTVKSRKQSPTEKVVNYLKNHPHEQLTPKHIALLANVSHENAKKICKRQLDKGIFEQPHVEHYQYKHFVSFEELSLLESYQELLSHNLMLILGDKKGVPPISGTIKKPLHHWTYENTGLQEFNKREIKVFEYKYKTVFYIGCGFNPLKNTDFSFFMGFLAAKGYDVRQARIGRHEINNDIEDVNIEGAQTIEVMTFKNGLERYYNKGRNLRHETIVRGSTITLEEALAGMRGKQALGTNTLIEQGLRQKERDNELIDQLKNMRHEFNLMQSRGYDKLAKEHLPKKNKKKEVLDARKKQAAGFKTADKL